MNDRINDVFLDYDPPKLVNVIYVRSDRKLMRIYTSSPEETITRLAFNKQCFMCCKPILDSKLKMRFFPEEGNWIVTCLECAKKNDKFIWFYDKGDRSDEFITYARDKNHNVVILSCGAETEEDDINVELLSEEHDARMCFLCEKLFYKYGRRQNNVFYNKHNETFVICKHCGPIISERY